MEAAEWEHMQEGISVKVARVDGKDGEPGDTLVLQAEGEGEASGGGNGGGAAAGRFKACAFHGLDGGLLQFRKTAGRDNPYAIYGAGCRDVQFERDITFLAALTGTLGIFGLDPAAGHGRLVYCDARLRWGRGGRSRHGWLLRLGRRVGLGWFRQRGTQVGRARFG